MSDARVDFTRGAAERIARAVRIVETGERDGAPLTFKRPVESGGGKPLRIGTISVTWNKGSTATVTEQKGDGTAKSPTVTFTAKNYFANVTVSSGTKRVACAKVDDTWILIAAEC
jgi:hypothetical protein